MEIKIYVAYHKDSPIIENSIFTPIQVGRANSTEKLNMIGDDTGVNISNKNPIYCEMSAIYWAWKNDVYSDFVGLCHYRRIFTLKRKSVLNAAKSILKYYAAKILNFIRPGIECSYSTQIQVQNIDTFNKLATEFSDIIGNKVDSYDAIVPYPSRFATINVRRFFEISLEHKLLMDSIVHDLNPNFEKWYKKTMKGNQLYSANMFVFSREVFEEYCNIVFPILEEHEKRTIEMGWCYDIIKEKSYSRRSGYFGEFLTSAFILMISESKRVLHVNTAYLDV